MTSRLTLCLALAALAVGCSEPPSDAGDSGSPHDAGAPADSGSTDAGPTPDSGQPVDSGTPDAGGVDSGTMDAGGTDAGGFLAVRQFDGDVGAGMATCQDGGVSHCDRPEMNVASNGTQVVQITWQHVNVYDYGGNLLHSTPLTTFITNGGLSPLTPQGKTPYEPHVVFDEFIGRWIITSSCLADCVLVSATSDAASTWKGFYLAGLNQDPGMHVGYDKNGVYLSEFHTGDSDSNTVNYSYDYFAIPSAEMQWTGTLAPTHTNRTHNTPLDGMPILDHNPNKLPTDPAFFMAKSCSGSSCQNSNNYTFDWLVNPVTWSGTTATVGPDQLVKTAVGSTQSAWLYNTPLNGTQPGTAPPFRLAESHRVIDVFQTGTHLNAVMGSGPCTGSCGNQGVDTGNLFFWADLDCSTPSACTVSQTAKGSSAADSYGFPTLGVDANGNVGIVAAAFSAGTPTSIQAWRHLASGPANALTGPVTFTTGTQPYSCINSPVSFGTAVGLMTALDPSDPTKLWATHQYGNDATACVWGTRIIQYQLQ